MCGDSFVVTGGYHIYCKNCFKDNRRKKSRNEYYLNREDNIIKKTKYSKTKKGRYVKYKLKAKERNIEFELSFGEFINFWNSRCFYCGDTIIGIGLDRIDSGLGYKLDNIVPCCCVCNKMKMELSQKIFIEQCDKISKNTIGF